MHYELKSIGIWSLIKTAFFVNLAMGLVIGFIYALIFGFVASVSQGSSLFGEMGIEPADISLGFLFIVLPLFFAIMAAFFQTLFMVLLASLYNLIARTVGGLVISLGSTETLVSRIAEVAPVQTSQATQSEAVRTSVLSNVPPLPPPFVRSEPTFTPEPRPAPAAVPEAARKVSIQHSADPEANVQPPTPDTGLIPPKESPDA